MTLFIDSSPRGRGEDGHDEDTYLLDSKNSLVRQCGRIADETTGTEVDQKQESALARLSPNDANERAEARLPSGSECFEVEADLVTVSFSASSFSPRLTILVSTKKLRCVRWDRIGGKCIFGRGYIILVPSAAPLLPRVSFA